MSNDPVIQIAEQRIQLQSKFKDLVVLLSYQDFSSETEINNILNELRFITKLLTKLK